ncbi:MAG: AAA family ATPase [Chlamydiia bacterium]|nr:AAA family ATPase [Chlamydiia bacterium]
MYQRFCELVKNHSFFLFGPRGSGKTTLLHKIFHEEKAVFYDLLDAEVEEMFRTKPNQLSALIDHLPEQITHIIIDEIQKVPKLLDEVHRLIEKDKKKHFILTCSSARKLKRGGANLLAGRAFVYNLFPLSVFELGDQFDMEHALHWGTLPKLFTLGEPKLKDQYLRAYTQTYLKEEVWGEQIVGILHLFVSFWKLLLKAMERSSTLQTFHAMLGSMRKP